jgi:hypothetical protein
MTQFDPNMVAQMLMQPVGRESLDNSIADENYFEAIEIPSGMVAPLDMQGGFFIDPEMAGKVAYGSAVAGASFVPGAGFVDAAGGAVDIYGQPLLSFGENIRQGNYLDAGLQALGVAGDVATYAAPFTLGASALVGALLKGPGAARKITKATDVARSTEIRNLPNRVLHGTLVDNVDSIKKLGIVPEVGENVSFSYGEYEDLLKPFSFFSGTDDIDRSLSAIKNQVGIKLGKQASEVTDADIVKHGALVVSRVEDTGSIFRVGEGGETFTLTDEKGFFDAPVSGETDDIVSSETVKPSGILTGQKLKKFLENRKLIESTDVASDVSKIDLPTDSSKVNNLDMGVIKAKQVSEGSDTVLEYPNLFHGSTEKGLEFLDIEKSRRTSMGAIPAINATENKQLATAFTRGELGDKPEGEIYNLKGPFKILNLDSKNGRGLWEDVYGKDPQKALKDGYDGIQFNQVENMRVEAFYKDIDLADIKGAKEIQLFKPKIDILKK